ncbi:hypothetical protein JNUCC83_05255 [Vagococcus sp. JNUCC 83]
MESLLKKLNSLFWEELLSCIMFPFLYLMLCDFSLTKINLPTFFNILVISIILAEGALYWKLTINRVKKRRVINRYVIGKIYHLFKIIDIILLVLTTMIIIGTLDSFTESQIVIQVFIYIFSLLEYINYFHTRLSFYGKKGRFFQIKKPIAILFSNKQKTRTHIANDIIYYKMNKQK